MTTITLSNNPSIAAWETAIDSNGIASNLDGVRLKGFDAAAYLFGTALASYSGAAASATIRRSDAVFEFPADSGNLASLNEIADALRYKYDIDPLIEFSARYGVPSYTVADLNAVLAELNRDFSGKFTLQSIELTPLALGDYEIDTRPMPASLEDIVDADGRAALLAMAQTLQDSLSADSDLCDAVARGEVGMNDAVFGTQSLRNLLDTAEETLGEALDTFFPDGFSAGRFSLATLNSLMAAAAEANPDEAPALTSLSSAVTPTAYQAARTDWLADIRRGLHVSYAAVSGFDAQAQSDDVRNGLQTLADALAAYTGTDAGISRLAVQGHLDPQAQEIPFNGELQSFNGLVETLQLQTYVAAVLPNLDAQGLTLRDINKLLATARELDPASADQWPEVAQTIRAQGDDGRTYTGAQAFVQALATALHQWLLQNTGSADDASSAPLDRDAEVFADPLASAGSASRLSINQLATLSQQALGLDLFDDLSDWFRADLLTLRDTLYAELPCAQLPLESAPAPLDQAQLVAFINQWVPVSPPLTGRSILATDAVFLNDQAQAVSLSDLLDAEDDSTRASLQSMLTSWGLLTASGVSLAGLRQLIVWSQSNLDGVTADPDQFVPDAPNGALLTPTELTAQMVGVESSRALVEDFISRMQAHAADPTADWDTFSAEVQALLSTAPEDLDVSALQTITAQSLPSLADFRTWTEDVSQRVLGVIEQYDRTVEGITASLASPDLQDGPRAALESVLATVQDRHDRFVEALTVLVGLTAAATDRTTLWAGLSALSSDPLALSLLTQIPDAGDDVLQMFRRFDVPTDAIATYRAEVADIAPDVLDLALAQSVAAPTTSAATWQGSMQTTFGVMSALRDRMSELAGRWSFDIGYLNGRAVWNPSSAASDAAAVARIQVWYDDVVSYGSMLDQLLAVQSDPVGFSALLAQFQQEKGATDLLDDMGRYSLPRLIGGSDWWNLTNIPFRNTTANYSYLDIDLWNSNLDYSAFLLTSGERVGALADISDASVTQALEAIRLAQRAFLASDAGALSLVDGTSGLGAADFGAIAAELGSDLDRTLEALSSSIAQIQALQTAEQYLVDAGQNFTLFDADEFLAMGERLSALTQQREDLNAARSVLADLVALGASPSAADFSAALNQARATLFPDGSGTEDVMAHIYSYALTDDQLAGGSVTLALHAQSFDPGAWRADADFSGNSYNTTDLDPHGAFDQDASWAAALQDLQDQLSALPDAADLLARLNISDDTIDSAVVYRSQQGLTQRVNDLHAAMLRTDLATTDIPADLRAPWVEFVNTLGQLSASDFDPDGVIDIDTDLFDPVNGSATRSLRDLLTAMQVDDRIDALSFVSTLGIVVDNRWASREGLNRLIEVMASELPDDVTAEPFAAPARVSVQLDDGSALADVAAVVQYVQTSLRGLDDLSVFSTVAGISNAVRITDEVLVDPDAPSQTISLETLRLRVSMRWGMDPFVLMDEPGRTVITAEELNGWKALLYFGAQAMAEDPNATADTAPWYDPVTTGGTPLATAIDPALVTQARSALAQITSTDFAIGALDINAPLMRDASGDRLSLRDLLTRLGVMDTLRARGVVMDHYITAAGFNRMTEALGSLFAELDVDPVTDPLDNVSFNYMFLPVAATGSRAALYTAVRVIGSLEGSLEPFSTIDGVPYALSTDDAVFDDPSSPGAKVSLDTLRARLLAATGFDLFATFSTDAVSLGHGSRIVTAQELNGLTAMAAMAFDTSGDTNARTRVQNWSAQDIPDNSLSEVLNNESYNRFSGVYDPDGNTINLQLAALFCTPAVSYDPSTPGSSYTVQNFAGRITIADSQSVLRNDALLVEAPGGGGGESYLDNPQYAFNRALFEFGYDITPTSVILSCDNSGIYGDSFASGLADALLNGASQSETFFDNVWQLTYGTNGNSQVRQRFIDAGGFEALFSGSVPSPFTLNALYGVMNGVNSYLLSTNWANVPFVPSLSYLQNHTGSYDSRTWGYNQATIDSIKTTVQNNLATMLDSVTSWSPPPPPPELSNWAQALMDASSRYISALDAGPGQALAAADVAAQSAALDAQVADLNALSTRFAEFAGLSSAQRTTQWPDWRDATNTLLDTLATDWGVSDSALRDQIFPAAWTGALADVADGDTPSLSALREARAEIDQARDGLNRQLLSLAARVSDDADDLATALAAVQVRSATSPYENLLSDLMAGLQSLGDDQFDADGQLLATATLTGPRGQSLSLEEFLAELQADAPDDVRAALQEGGGLQALAGEDMDLAAFTRTARDQWVSALAQALPALADQLTITPVSGSAVSAVAERVTLQATAVRSGMDQMSLWWEQLQAWAGQGLNTRTGLAANPAVDESELGYLHATVDPDYDAADPDTWYADAAGGSLWGRVRLAMDGLTHAPDASGADADAWRADFYASVRQMVTVLGGARDRAGFARTQSLAQFQDLVQTLSVQQPFVDALAAVTQAWANGSDANKLSSSAWNTFRANLQAVLDDSPLTTDELGLDASLLDAALETDAPEVTSTMTQNWLTGMNTRVDLLLSNLYSSSSRLAALQCPAGVDSGAFGQAKGEEIAALQTVIDRYQKVATVLDQIGSDTFNLETSKTFARALGDPEVTDLMAYLWSVDVAPEALSLYRTDGALRDSNGDEIASYSAGHFDFGAWQSAVIGTRQSPYADSQLTQGPTAFEQLNALVLARQQSLHNAQLQAQANLNFSAADVGEALSRLQRVLAPSGYDGLWYQMALALQNISEDDLGADGVSLDLPILTYPAGSTTRVSFNDLLAQLEEGMPEGATLFECFSGVSDFSLGNASGPVLDASSRQALLVAIYAALPTVAQALSGYPLPAATPAVATFAAVAESPADVIGSRIAAQRTGLLETPRVLSPPPATELELRQLLGDGAEVYVDHWGAFYINGIRTTARDLSITSRFLVQDKLGLEYKRLMDGMAERNNLIAAARDTLTTLSNATGVDADDRLTLYASLYAKQQLLGFDDLLSEMTAGQFTMDDLFRTPALQSNNGALAAGHRPTLQDLSTYLSGVKGTIEATRTFYQERVDASNARASFYARFGNDYNNQLATLYSRQQTWDGYIDEATQALALADQLQTLIDDSADPSAFSEALIALETTTGESNLIGSLADYAMPADVFSYGQLPPDTDADWAAGRLWGDDNTIRVWDGSQNIYRNIDVDWSSATLGLTLNTPDAILVINALGTYENSLWTVDAFKWQLGEIDGPTQSFGLETYFYDVTGRTGLLDVYGDPARGHKYVTGLYQDEMWKLDASIDSFGASERSTLTSLLNTLISNKIRDGDLDQAKLQSLTAQLQNNVELMSALLKAFNELTTNLARAL